MITLNVKTPHSSYPIYIEDYLLNSIETLIDDCKTNLIITDTGVPHQYIKTIMTALKTNDLITVKEKEMSKSLPTYESIILSMQEKNYSKDTRIIALGGGVVGDLAGFVASTYMRGIEFIQIPTTLLSMVDSSIGGKVAINTHYSKNSIGAFYFPDKVIIDPKVLSTLPQREFNHGMAEVIKMALTSNKNFVYDLSHQLLDINTIIYKAIMIKKQIVEQDPYDLNERHLLNFGHTIGHALEQYHNYQFLHGECIAQGIRYMVKGESFENDVIHLLDSYGLKKTIPYDLDALKPYLLKDKKQTKNGLKIILLKSLGNGYIKTINKDDILNYIC